MKREKKKKVMEIWLALSNLIFLVDSYIAFVYARYTRAFIYLAIVFASGSYHLCKSYVNACLFDYTVQRNIDFFFAEFVIPLTAFYLMDFGRLAFLETWLILLTAVVLALIQISGHAGMMVHGAIAVTSASLLIGYWALTCCRRVRYNFLYLFIGIFLTALGVILFTIQETWMDAYWALHSLWHVLVGLGQYFIIITKPPAKRWQNLATRLPVVMSRSYVQ